MNSRPSSHLPPPDAAHPLRTLWEHPDGTIYHTYSTTWRGLEFFMSYYPILDHTPKGAPCVIRPTVTDAARRSTRRNAYRWPARVRLDRPPTKDAAAHDRRIAASS